MLLEHPANFFFLVYLSVIRRFTAAVYIVFSAKQIIFFRKQRQFSSKESIIYVYDDVGSGEAFETLCQCIFKHRLADSIYVSSLSLLLLLSPKISKKHLNERQILAIQYISRGAYPSFANFCNRGEDYSLWAGKGELFLSNFSPRLWGVRKPFSHVQKTKKERNRSYFYNVPSVSAFW